MWPAGLSYSSCRSLIAAVWIGGKGNATGWLREQVSERVIERGIERAIDSEEDRNTLGKRPTEVAAR